ncbi:MAG TPA: DUF11 domain-containing protein, partial [Thermoanaerobaculia bacterium]|nr:DUF11 domain-containing protein [Thermoanaerobaculia bacterium]
GGTEIAGTGIGVFDGNVGPMILDGRGFNDYGTTTFISPTNPLALANDATFNVYGNFDFQSDGGVSTDGSATSFNIAPNGFLSKSAGSGTTVIAAPANNSSTVLAASGTLDFDGGGNHSGCFFPAFPGVLAFSTNANTASGCIFGDGTVSFPSGSTFVTGSYDVGATSITGGFASISSGFTTDFLLDGGTLDSGDFTMTGTGTWASGTISDSGGTFDVAGGATLTISAANGVATLNDVTFENDGTVNYTATPASGNDLELENGAQILNKGTFDIRDDQPIRTVVVIIGTGRTRPSIVAIPVSITNDGTWKKSAGSGTNDIDPPFTTDGTVLAQSGTMHFIGGYTQTAGETTLGAGGIKVDTALQLQGGVLDGVGTITGDLQNDATVAPNGSGNTGTINVSGNYTQGSGGALNIELASPTGFDQLAAGGAVTLDGTLNVALLNSYAPVNGQTWPVLTFASRSGDFAVKNLPTYPPSGSITANYTPTELDLTAVVTAQANLAVTKNGPSGVVAGQNVVYTVTVTNNGPSTATNAVVSDPTPANLTFVSNSGDCTSPYPCSFPSLSSGQTVTITSTYSTSPSFAGNVTNTATASSSTPDPDTSDNSATATTNVGAQSDLGITKSGPATVA